MLLLLVMGMLVVLVVLMVLEEQVVFLGGVFENIISTNFFCEKFIEYKKKLFDAKINLKILKTKSIIHLYFRVVNSSIPLSK